MDEKGKKLYTIKSSAYLPIMVMIIGVIAILIVAQIKGRLEGGLTTLIVLVPVILMVAKICTDFLKNVQVYDKCIMIGKRIINYEDIEAIELKKKDYDTGMRFRSPGTYGSVGKFKDENFIQIKFKEGFVEDFLMSNYSLKQVRTIVECIEHFTKCDISQAKEFLDMADAKHRKDLIISAIVVVIFVIISIIFVKLAF